MAAVDGAVFWAAGTCDEATGFGTVTLTTMVAVASACDRGLAGRDAEARPNVVTVAIIRIRATATGMTFVTPGRVVKFAACRRTCDLICV